MSSAVKTESQHQRQVSPSAYPKYNAFHSKLTGAGQITMGILLVLCHIVFLAGGYFDGSGLGHGIWGGAFIILSGSFGLAAARKNKCLVIAYMVLCILSAILCVLLAHYSFFGALVATWCVYYANQESDTVTDNPNEFSSTTENPYALNKNDCQDGNSLTSYYRTGSVQLVIHALMLIFTLIDFICAIWGSIICYIVVPCCCPCCCSKDTYTEANEVQVKLMETSPAAKNA